MRTRSAAPPIQFTVDQRVVQQVKEEQQQQLKNKVVVTNGEEEEEGEEEEGEGMNGVESGEGAVPMVNGKVDTESQAYKDAVLACSRENKEACTMCSA